MPLKQHYIKRLIEEGESRNLDFKFEISDARKIARTFVAFANTDGGKLLIGVKDDGTIAGIRSEEEKYMATTAANLFCRPQIAFSSKEWEISKKVVLEIDVPRGPNQPYMAQTSNNKWQAFIRVDDQNITANRILVKALRRKNSPDGTHIIYTGIEKKLLEYLEMHNSISLSKFTRITGISNRKAEQVLVNFLAIGIIEQFTDDMGIQYRLSEYFTENEPET
jgi:predicted HTH transcriptional regulator